MKSKQEQTTKKKIVIMKRNAYILFHTCTVCVCVLPWKYHVSESKIPTGGRIRFADLLRRLSKSKYTRVCFSFIMELLFSTNMGQHPIWIKGNYIIYPTIQTGYNHEILPQTFYMANFPRICHELLLTKQKEQLENICQKFATT